MSKRGAGLPTVEKCDECGKRMRKTIVDHYQYAESGLSNVYLDRIAVYMCDCGEKVVALPNVERLHDLIFQKILTKPSTLRGEEVRFLRQSMGARSIEFAKMVNVHPATLSKWEHGDQEIGKEYDKLIRYSVVLTVTSQLKQQLEDAHRRIADKYLDFLNEIRAIPPLDTTIDDRVEISQSDLASSSLTFRWGLDSATDVELAEN